MVEEDKMVNCEDDNTSKELIDENEGPLPGFRFHPTDEELVSFYLRRKVEKRPVRIELIKQIDIYKHDPWDLAKASGLGDKEWYFYCKRGRKYRNSIRPNRVTGSGFWKATGIDRPIYSYYVGEGRHCIIGLKKSLVYYRGSAGKGTKTDWMMHEFRLPASHHYATDDTPQDAEIWTLCRIFKRNKKYTPDWREMSAKKTTSNAISQTKWHAESTIDDGDGECYISFQNYGGSDDTCDKGILSQKADEKNGLCHNGTLWRSVPQTPLTTSWYSGCSLNQPDGHENQFSADFDNWDDLSSIVKFVVPTPLQ
ncbi:hypothetical protein Nepgr_001167 [Nepenthes gracilis]|uniref:NAC domain-containing protein n=1 Tax=Nepenthes gracilis TaxID=150966 RepID=A0AAD3RXC9_NEPGR|nr:hypothetical protein Nepgr_001167 [Nepenthes gracilis]